jgi:membrane protease YdiL (CAAX protease family)
MSDRLALSANRQPADDYWSQSRQPLVSLAFLAPLLVIYEVGALWLGNNNTVAIRNGADYWMRSWLGGLGFGQIFLLPGLLVVGLLAWHVIGKFPSRVSTETLAGMFAESLLFAFALIVLGQLQDLLFQKLSIGRETLAIGELSTMSRAVTYVGAGIYEEVLFRMCLLPLCYGLCRVSRLSVVWSAVMAVLISSLIFSLAHYVGSAADTFSIFSFLFRTLAGAFFAVLFCLRGLGITVGCHAAYDLLVGVLFAPGG